MATATLVDSKWCGSTISSSNSAATIAIGDSISVAVGNSTSVKLGASTSLSIAAASSITLGTNFNVSLSTTMSWAVGLTRTVYSDTKSELGVDTTNSATGKYIIQGGTTTSATNMERVSARRLYVLTALAAAASFGGVVASCIIDLANPPVTVNSTNTNATVTDTSGNPVTVQTTAPATTSISWNKWGTVNAFATTFIVGLIAALCTKFTISAIKPAPVGTITVDNDGVNITTTNGTATTYSTGLLMQNNGTQFPNVSFTASDSTGIFCNIFYTQTGITLKSKGATGFVPTVTLDNSTNGGQISIINNASQPDASIVMDNTATQIMRPAQNTLLQVGDAATNSALNLQNNQVVLSATGGGQTGAVTVTPTSVTIGTAGSNAVFDSGGITLGTMKITPAQISIGGGALTITAGGSPQISSAIQSAQQAAIQDATKYQALITALTQKLELEMEQRIAAVNLLTQQQRLFVKKQDFLSALLP